MEKKIWKFTYAEAAAFFVALFLMVVVYIPWAANMLQGPDGTFNDVFSTWHWDTSLGRWMIILNNVLIRNDLTLPVYTASVSAIMVAVIALLWTRMFFIRSPISGALVGALTALFPCVASQMTVFYFVWLDFESCLFATLSIYVVAKSKSARGIVLGTICTKWFYKIFNSLSSVQIRDGQRDYRLMTRQVVDAIIRHKEYNLFDKGYFTDVGFRTKWITFENVERPAGETKWPFKRLLKFSISGIIGYSVLPLKAVSAVGMLEMGIAVILLLLMLVLCILQIKVAYIPILIAAGALGLFGVQMMALGVLAAYIAQIHTETKARPRFIVRETINLDISKKEKEIDNEAGPHKIP